ncbi:General transcription and DNA repair factor IIH helicase subunit XPB [Dictyocoela muelleri]|nr:General transcription and DNA repair factor IIH helicase subunit XPB [Dictyocoela muelleri]
MNSILLPKKAAHHTFKFENLKMKEDHEKFPIWITHNAQIILETFNPLSRQATDFLIAISEPVSRPILIHEYKITSYSLYAAASVGLTTEDILSTLNRFSKNYLPKGVVEFIEGCTKSYGKIKLILKNGKYFLEANDQDSFNLIARDSVLCECRVKNGDKMPSDLIDEEVHDDKKFLDSVNETSFSRSFEVTDLEKVRKRCIEIDYPLIDEYDFRNDTTLKNLDMDLRSNVAIRTYQEVSLNKMFGNGRARSGIIVLPCGSGKTLVGITAICTIKKPCLIICTSAVSVEQWRQQLIQFTTISPNTITRFTSDKKEKIEDIVITTYTMLAYSGKRSFEAQKAMDVVNSLEFGLLILDEVHVVPAQMFRRVISLVNHHCKLGLTATLVREDDKIEDLNFLIGPKLYEADWQDLSAQGHIASVECVEVWCGMTAEFYREYLVQPQRRKRVISVMNPTKFQMCDYLIRKHEKKGDKIIVFSDNVCALKTYALKLGKPYIYGPTGQAERMKILRQFQTNPRINTIFLSKVGDTSIDIPEATCLIQISSHFGSRRQEAQRLGRILRAKKRNDPGFKVFFYTLVSKDTNEMYYSSKRQQFLIDQGYTFRVIEANGDKRIFTTKAEQKELLASILMASEIDLESEDSEDKDQIVRRKIKNVTSVDNVIYKETKRRHSLFRNNK